MKSQAGVVLISVLLLLTVIAGLSLWIGQGGVLALRLMGDAQKEAVAKSVAQAGMSHLLWRAQRSGLCDGYQNLTDESFDGHSYSATISPTTGSPVRATVTATLADGETQYTFLRESQIMHSPAAGLTHDVGYDTYIDSRSAYESTDYGNSGTLLVGALGGAEQSTLLQFPADEFPTSGKIESATLGFTVSNITLGGLLAGETAEINANRIRQTWGDDVTWDERDWTLGYDPDPAGSLDMTTAVAGWHEIDLTQLVQSWVDGTYVNAGVALTPGENISSISIASDENLLLGAAQLDIVYRCECGVDCAPGTQALPDALAHWKLDETSGTTAVDSIGGHDGTASGTIWTEGADFGAAGFDGVDDRIVVPHDSALELTEMTITAWVYPRSFGPLSNGWRTIVTKGETSSHEDYWLGLYTNELQFGILVSDTWHAVTTSFQNIPPDTWTHVAATFSSGSDEVQLYINGILEETDSITVDPSASGENLQIGRSKFGEHWDGRLDDIRLYNEILTQPQIALIRDSAVAPVSGENTWFALDEFNAVAYSGDDGTRNWSGNWAESGDSSGASGGDVRVTSDLLRNYVLEVSNANNQIERHVDLSGCSTLSVSTEYRQSGLDSGLWIWPPDEVALEVSADGGANWETLNIFRGPATNLIYASGSWTAATAPTADTRIRLRSNDRLDSGDQVYFDNFKVQGSGCD